MTEPETVTTIPGCCTIRMPRVHRMPVVFASPHSGRAYPSDFMATARLDKATLRRSEDSHVDDIFADAPHQGAPLIAATFPRAYCDVNREAWELDPAMFEDTLPPWVNTTSARVGAGLGTIARVVANGETIYGIRLRFADAEARVQNCWQPYHNALAGLIDLTVARFGVCLLVDCHSMPSSATTRNKPPPDIVLGDVHGAACAPAVMRAIEQFYARSGYATRRNDPYAGGYVTRHYGRPHRNVHAIQIEIARALYMNETTLEPSAGMQRLLADSSALMQMLPFVVAALPAGDQTSGIRERREVFD
jgi:N-formylglutamate amidohydrolase